MNLTVEFKNFKKVKEFTHEFQSGNVYVVGGPNDIGKTTFLQGIASLCTGIPGKNNCVSFGEERGQIKGEFEFDGANGNTYIVKYDFTQDSDKFIIIDPDTNVIKSTSRNNAIADIFKYNAFTIDEWFGWGLTTDGRKKQADIILNLLSESAREEYLNIEAEVSEKTGLLFKKRTDANREYDAAKTIVDTFKLSEEEQEQLNKLEEARTLLKSLNADLESALSSDRPRIEMKLISAEREFNFHQEKVSALENSVNDIQKEIKRLEEDLSRKRKELSEISEQTPTFEKNISAIRDELRNCPEAVDTESIRERINKGKDFISVVEKIEQKKVNYENAKKTAQIKLSEVDDLNNIIKEKRERKKQIIEENKLPIDNIVISNGECFYVDGDNLIPFTKDSVSYSTGGMMIIKLMAHLNKKLPIWLVGSAESYDNSRLPKLIELAKEYNGIIFMDRVIPDSNQGLTINILES